MSLRTVALIAVLLLAVAGHAAGQATADRVFADGLVRASSPDARPVLDLAGSTFVVEARSATLLMTDDWNDVYRSPFGGGGVFAADFHHDTETVELDGVRLGSLGSDDDGRLLVTDVGADYRVTSALDGRLEARGATDEVVEHHHYYSSSGDDEVVSDPTDDWREYYYEYRSGTELDLLLQGDVVHAVEGGFTVYLWGTTFEASTEDGIRTYRTGAYETRSEVGAGILVQQHYVYAVLEVHDGTLTARGARGALYGGTFSLELDGVALFTDADGAIATSDGRRALSGSTVVEGGTYGLSREASDVRVAVLEAPLSVQGGMSAAPATPSPGPWFAAASAALLVVAGMVHARPVVVAGLAQARYRRIARHEVPPLSWRELRADGHHRLGCRAEVRGAYRIALWHVDRSLRVEPDNPEVFAMRGSILRRLGRHGEAVESHKRAHEWLDVCEGDRDDLAHNAYEAARACALDGRTSDAVHWLGIAVQGDPDLRQDLVLEPDFAAIAETREFQAFVRGEPRPCGRRGRPASFAARHRSGDPCEDDSA